MACNPFKPTHRCRRLLWNRREQSTLGPSEKLLRRLKRAADKRSDDTWISYDLLRWMICQCEVRHGPKCKVIPTNSDGHPHWLIDVRRLCLVTQKCDASTRYAALSYVWGGDQEGKTTLGNREARQKPGSLSEENQRLPRTIRHAIQLAEKLEIGLLWVDSLCIAQNMDAESMKPCLDAMGSIYRQALVTIVASASPDANSGLTGLRGISGPRPKPTYSRTERPQLPWYGRGWTFQELLCSNRRIFLDEQVIWECNHTAQLESTGTSTSATFVPPSQIWGRDFSFDKANMGKYGEIIDNYTLRTLTHDHDIHTALKGVLSLFEKSFRGGFLYAIPELFFDVGLLWQPLGNNLGWGRPGEFPSWSWLGWKGPTDCNNFHRAKGRERWDRSEYFAIRDIEGHAGFVSLCRWYQFQDDKWQRIESSCDHKELTETASDTALNDENFGAAMSASGNFKHPKPAEQSRFLYCRAAKGFFRITERNVPNTLQERLGVDALPYEGLRSPHLCILDSQGAACGVLPRGLPQNVPSEGVYEFVAISGFSIGPRRWYSNSDDDDDQSSQTRSGRPESNTENDEREEGVDEESGDEESGIEKGEEDMSGDSLEEGDSSEGYGSEESEDDAGEVGVNEEDRSEESGDEESEGSRSASNAHYKSEPTDYQGLCRYNVLLIGRKSGAAYHRVALGLMLSDAWERESTEPTYIQLE